jgi:hypothetical protein
MTDWLVPSAVTLAVTFVCCTCDEQAVRNARDINNMTKVQRMPLIILTLLFGDGGKESLPMGILV